MFFGRNKSCSGIRYPCLLAIVVLAFATKMHSSDGPRSAGVPEASTRESGARPLRVRGNFGDSPELARSDSTGRARKIASKPGRAANRSTTATHRISLSARPLGMYYYSDDSHGAASLHAHLSRIKLLAPQCFSIDGEGTVRGSIPAPVLDAARRQGIPIMPLLYNRGFDRASVTAMLQSASARSRAIAYMAYLGRVNNLAGFQIDLENADPAAGSLLTSFVEAAAARMHRDGRLLSVAVVPRLSDAPFVSGPATAREPAASDSSNESRVVPAGMHTSEWAAPFDYRALSRAADFLVVMAYDHFNRNTRPGPIADHAWVKKVLDYAVARVPRSKLLLGLPLYGREWTESEQGISARTLSFKDVEGLTGTHKVRPRWDPAWRAPGFQFRDASGLHTVWFEDTRSLTDKFNLVREYNLRGFAAWRLGDDSPAFWGLVARARPKRVVAVRRPTAAPTGGRRPKAKPARVEKSGPRA
jgi:spore germination protein YaaH